MRDYKFRGKRKDNGEWVYGCPLETKMSGVYIIGTRMKSKPNKQGVGIGDVVWQHEVDPETVGQYTGFHDKKRTAEYPEGKDIYEGDIVRFESFEDKWGDTYYEQLEVKWDLDIARYVLGDNEYDFNDIHPDCAEVIGNIYDNPELLQEVTK